MILKVRIWKYIQCNIYFEVLGVYSFLLFFVLGFGPLFLNSWPNNDLIKYVKIMSEFKVIYISK